MHRISSMCLEAGVAALILFPIFLALNWRKACCLRRTAECVVFSVYLAAVDAVVGLPNVTYVRFDLNLNLMPFAYMFSDATTSLLNVALFLPLGFLLPILCQKFRKLHWTVLFGFCASLLIELLHIFTFRATDVNDLITNTVGTILGWCAARVVFWLFPGITPKWSLREVFLVCFLTLGVMFFLQPFLARTLGIPI